MFFVCLVIFTGCLVCFPAMLAAHTCFAKANELSQVDDKRCDLCAKTSTGILIVANCAWSRRSKTPTRTPQSQLNLLGSAHVCQDQSQSCAAVPYTSRASYFRQKVFERPGKVEAEQNDQETYPIRKLCQYFVGDKSCTKGGSSCKMCRTMSSKSAEPRDVVEPGRPCWQWRCPRQALPRLAASAAP